jgi:hypothetical protein
MSLTHIEVGECYIDVEGLEKIPVSRFDVTYALNEIPSANIVPALGRPIEDDPANYGSVKDLEEGQVASLIIYVDGVENLLLKGVISSINTDDNAGVFSSTLSVTLTIHHRTISLAGSPSSSFIVSQTNSKSIGTLINQKKNYRMFGADAEEDDIDSESGILSAFTRDNVAEGSSSEAVLATCKYLTNLFRPSYPIDDILFAYEGANINEMKVPTESHRGAIAAKYRSAWADSNNWEALKRTCDFLLMSLIPYNEGMIIGNPMGLIREPDVSLTSEEYLSMRQSLQDTSERVDGVIIDVPITAGQDSVVLSFPPLTSQDPEGEILKENKHYRILQMPSWLYPLATFKYGKSIAGGGGTKVGLKNKAAVRPLKRNTPDNLATYFQDVGGRFVRALYAQVKIKKAQVQLALPFRTDLMPGTNIKFESTDNEDLSFIGDTLYGMVQSLRISGDMTRDKGVLNSYINVGNVRNEKDNNSNAYTFVRHPVFNETWKAIDINGEVINAQ